MAQCFVCKKGNVRGHNVSHSNVKTNRLFKPNLHKLSVRTTNDGTARVNMCAKCYKKIKNDFWEGKKTSITPISLINQKQHKKVLVKAQE